MTAFYCAVMAAMVLVLGASVAAGGFTLVDGSHRAVIAVPMKPSAGEAFAASEIAKYAELMSGAKLEIVESESPAVGSIVLRSGRDLPLAPSYEEGGHAGAQPKEGREWYSISVSDGRLVIAGERDRGLIYAAYDLLGRLGCRWVAPKLGVYGDRAEVVPKRARLAIDLEEPIVERPALKFRKLYVEEGLSHDTENLKQMVEWMSKSRWNTLVVPIDYQGSGRVKWDNWREALTPELRKRDLQIEIGGHGYQNYINSDMPEVKAHEEWLGLREGKRQTDHGVVPCTSNVEAVAFLTRNVIAYLKSHPEIDIFDFWPPDGSKWCECEACAKLGTPADRQARLVATVIAETRKQGIETRFECIAYSVYTQPPVDPAMDKSVLIDFCPINQCFEVQISDPSSDRNANYADAIRAWRKGFAGDISIYSYYRKYAWDSKPMIIPHYMQADLKWYEQLGVQGVSTYAEPGDWLTYELNHYALARLAWNPDADVDAIIAEFCKARFGKCADAAGKLYLILEDTVRHGCKIPFSTLKTPAELATYIERLRSTRNALAQEAGGNESVSALLASTDYALKDLALQKSIAEKGSPADRAKMVEDLYAFLESHRGQGLVIERRMSKERLMKGYGAL